MHEADARRRRRRAHPHRRRPGVLRRARPEGARLDGRQPRRRQRRRRRRATRTGARGPFPKLTKPLIGAINGVAVTGGFELALNCDFLVASERAKFGDTHARVGVMPGWGLTVLLPQAIGVRRAREMSFTGNFLSAEEALQFGLVNHVVAHDELLPFTRVARHRHHRQRARTACARSARRTPRSPTTTTRWEQEARDARAWQRTMFSADKVAERRAAIQRRGRTQ